MKDSEFIELLNLYLDHEISADDAVRLESEVQNNAARRRVYQDYCRMQKGCKLLAGEFATEAPAESEQKVVAFEQARAKQDVRTRNRYVAGGLVAAAACVALVFAGRFAHAPDSGASSPALAESPTPTVSHADVAPRVTAPEAMVTVANVPAQTPAAQNAFSIRNNGRGQSLMLGSKQSDPNLAWIQNVSFAPVQLPLTTDQLRLETNPDLQTGNRTYGDKALPANIERTAFRFQK